MSPLLDGGVYHYHVASSVPRRPDKVVSAQTIELTVVCVASGDYINFFAHHSNREPDGLHYVARLFVCVESMQAGLYVGNATLGRTVGSQRRCSWLVGQVAQSRASFNPMNTAKFGDSSGVPGKLCPKPALVDVFYVDNVDTSIHNRDRKSTRLNSSHVRISYAVFCLKKK